MGFTDVPSISDLGGSLADVADQILGDLVDTATGNSKLKQLSVQGESGGVNQFNTTPIDISQWYGPKTNFGPQYYFLLKYGKKTIQVPFLINPQSEQVQEPSATTTTYTQGGGKFIQHEGCLTKEIVISGTCGLYPNQTGYRKPDSGVKSGFEGFNLLKMVCRRYAFLRRFGKLDDNIKLIYVSRRRQEAWVVEPKSFTSDDAVDHNFHTRYSIVLETLEPYDGKDAQDLTSNLLSSIPGWNQISFLAQRATEILDELNASLGQLSAFINSFTTSAMQPFTSLVNALADLVNGRSPNIEVFKRDSLRGLANQFRSIGFALEGANQQDLADKAFRAEKVIYKTMTNQTPFEKKVSDKAKDISNLVSGSGSKFSDANGNSISPNDAIAAGAAPRRPDSSISAGQNQNTGLSLAQGLTGSASLPAGTISSAQKIENAKTNTTTPTSVGGAAQNENPNFTINRASTAADPTTMIPPSTSALASSFIFGKQIQNTIDNINPANSDYRSAKVNVGDDIKTLAYRLLGDHQRWDEIVTLNDLRHPYVASKDYIIANSLTNVLAYGANVLYPVPKQSSTINPKRVFRNETFESLSLSAIERPFGNDIFIDPKTGDIVWEANDLALTYGVNKISQFIRKRFLAKKGSYRRNLNIGFSDYLGLSAEVSKTIVGIDAQALFTDDDSITGVEILDVIADAGTLVIKAAVFVKDVQDPLISTFEV